MCRLYQELKSPKLVLPLGFLAAAAAAAVLVDGPLSSSAAGRFLNERRKNIKRQPSSGVVQ